MYVIDAEFNKAHVEVQNGDTDTKNEICVSMHNAYTFKVHMHLCVVVL